MNKFEIFKLGIGIKIINICYSFLYSIAQVCQKRVYLICVLVLRTILKLICKFYFSFFEIVLAFFFLSQNYFEISKIIDTFQYFNISLCIKENSFVLVLKESKYIITIKEKFNLLSPKVDHLRDVVLIIIKKTTAEK